MKKYTLEVVVFICGAAVMVLELIASRLLAPYLGTSYFVWTSIIGIIMASLSLGYWLGGKLSDQKPDVKFLSLIIFVSAIYIATIAFMNRYVLKIIQDSSDIRSGGIIASLALFAFPSILLGMVSPYAVKLKMKNVNLSGTTVGNLYAISTIGSIAGTFMSGFILVPYLGSIKILILTSVILIMTSCMFILQNMPIAKKVSCILLFILSISVVLFADISSAKHGVIDVDTLYNRVLIYDDIDYSTNLPVRRMQTGNSKGSVSSMFLNSDEPVFSYIKFYRLASHFNNNIKKSLLIGGGAYTYPRDYLANFADAQIDVVEIDPKLTELAKKYFRLRDDPRLTIYHEDGRIFLNKNQNKYDVFFGDAFKSVHSIPHQLTTKEAVKKIYDCLSDNGVAIINIISSIEGEKGKFLRAEYATYKSVFPCVYLFPVNTPKDGNSLQNIMLVALKSDEVPSFTNSDHELNRYLSHVWTKEIPQDMPVLTDDYAPVDHYIMKTIR